MKFVRYVYRKFPIYIGNLRYIYTTKYTLSWSKKILQNISNIYRKFPIFIYDKIHYKLEQKTLTKCRKFPTYFVGFFVSTYSEFVERCYKKKIFFQTASRTRRLEKYCLFCYTSRQIRCKLEQKNLRNKLEIYYRLFCSNLQCIRREV